MSTPINLPSHILGLLKMVEIDNKPDRMEEPTDVCPTLTHIKWPWTVTSQGTDAHGIDELSLFHSTFFTIRKSLIIELPASDSPSLYLIDGSYQKSQSAAATELPQEKPFYEQVKWVWKQQTSSTSNLNFVALEKRVRNNEKYDLASINSSEMIKALILIKRDISTKMNLSKEQKSALENAILMISEATQHRPLKKVVSLDTIEQLFDLKFIYQKQDHFEYISGSSFDIVATFVHAIIMFSQKRLEIYDHYSIRFAKSLVHLTHQLGLNSIVELAAGEGQLSACLKKIDRPTALTTDIKPKNNGYGVVQEMDAYDCICQRESQGHQFRTLYVASHPPTELIEKMMSDKQNSYIVLLNTQDLKVAFELSKTNTQINAQIAFIDVKLLHYSRMISSRKFQLAFVNFTSVQAQLKLKALDNKFKVNGAKLKMWDGFAL